MMRAGTRILITGSSRGIGAAIALRAADWGARVVVNFRADGQAAASTAELVRRRGGEALTIRADVRDRSQVEAMLDEVDKRFGGLDVLVNNAHSPFKPTPFEALAWSAVEEQIVGSVRTCFHCTQVALPYFRKGTGASVLNISSITARLPVRGFAHRNLAKAAVEGLTRSLALELSPLGIRVNALAVGWTRTEQLGHMPAGVVDAAVAVVPMSRLASPEEIAETAVFLVSPAASYITGMVMPVAGGLFPDPIPEAGVTS